MDPTISVSKGCFVFKNGATRAKSSTKKASKRKSASGILDKSVVEQPFYSVYAETWSEFQTHIEQLQQSNYALTLNEVVSYVTKVSTNDSREMYGLEEILPTVALLTGVNQSDHLEQFETLAQHIEQKLAANVCMLPSRDCPHLKAAVESIVYNFIEMPREEDSNDRDGKRLRRSQCTMKELKQWYLNNFPNTYNSGRRHESERDHSLVVILPDFECFIPSVLQDLVLILSSYCTTIPFILILGVATDISAIHNTLPYHVTSKIKLRIFKTPTAPVCLNEILDKVILSPKYNFHLSGKIIKFLTHIFLYYDFSINGFIQGFKYCIMEHFFQGNAYALCCNYSSSLTKIQAMTHDDMETIRRLLSFRPYVEGINNCKRIIAILTDDDYLKKKLPQLLRDCQVHFLLFRTFIEFLKVIVDDLPKLPLGKYRREIYAQCLSKEIVDQPEFKECWQMLSFMSKSEFNTKISNAIKATKQFFQTEISSLELAADCEKVVTRKLETLTELLAGLTQAGVTTTQAQTAQSSPTQFKNVASRHDLKEKLLQMQKQEKPKTEFGKAVDELLMFIQTEIIHCHLTPLSRAPPLHELFVYTDFATVRRNIIGAPRAALHTALNNPHFYLQCKCCRLEENTQLLPTMPDVAVAYKLHLECGRMINLFDWLQAFRSVIDYNEEERHHEHVDPLIQARFTRAVAELQFLGYIKMSKRKTDHATRLTW